MERKKSALGFFLLDTKDGFNFTGDYKIHNGGKG